MEISPKELTNRQFCKVPMVLILTSANVIVGIDLTLFKFAQAILAEDEFKESWYLVVPFIVLGALFAFYGLHLLNLCEKIFDQTDVVPTYYALSLITQIICGLVLLNENSLYNTEQLVLIFVASVVSVLGILLLVFKQSQIRFFTDTSKGDYLVVS